MRAYACRDTAAPSEALPCDGGATWPDHGLDPQRRLEPIEHFAFMVKSPQVLRAWPDLQGVMQ